MIRTGNVVRLDLAGADYAPRNPNDALRIAVQELLDRSDLVLIEDLGVDYCEYWVEEHSTRFAPKEAPHVE